LGVVVDVSEADTCGAVGEQPVVEQNARAAPHRGEPVDGRVGDRDVTLETIDEPVCLPVVAKLAATDDAVRMPGIAVAEVHASVEPLPDRAEWHFHRRLGVAGAAEVCCDCRGRGYTDTCGHDRRSDNSPSIQLHKWSS